MIDDTNSNAARNIAPCARLDRRPGKECDCGICHQLTQHGRLRFVFFQRPIERRFVSSRPCTALAVGDGLFSKCRQASFHRRLPTADTYSTPAHRPVFRTPDRGCVRKKAHTRLPSSGRRARRRGPYRIDRRSHRRNWSVASMVTTAVYSTSNALYERLGRHLGRLIFTRSPKPPRPGESVTRRAASCGEGWRAGMAGQRSTLNGLPQPNKKGRPRAALLRFKTV